MAEISLRTLNTMIFGMISADLADISPLKINLKTFCTTSTDMAEILLKNFKFRWRPETQELYKDHLGRYGRDLYFKDREGS